MKWKPIMAVFLGLLMVSTAVDVVASEPAKSVNTQSTSWIGVLEAAYKVYDALKNLLWTASPETEYGNGYVTAKTGTIQFGGSVYELDKAMPGWAGYGIELHGNSYNFDCIHVSVKYAYDGCIMSLGDNEITHNQYFTVTAPYTFPDNVHNSQGYLIEWVNEDNEKWVLWHTSYRPSGGGGCPYVATWNGKEYIPENTILTASEGLRERKSMDITDYYMLKNPETIKGNVYSIQLQEFENEISHIDSVKLLIVDYPADVKIGVTPDGKIIPYRTVKEIRNIEGQAYSKSSNLLGAERSVLVNFDNMIAADNQLLVITPYVKTQSTVRVQSFDGNSWNILQEIYPRAKPYSYAIELRGNKKVRVFWKGSHKISSAEIAIPVKAPIYITEASLLRAETLDGQDVTDKLLRDDRKYASLKPDEKITLSFNIPERKGERRSLVLVINGFYTKYPADFREDSVATFQLRDGLLFVPMLLTYDNIKDIEWDFGDGSASTSFIAFHKYADRKPHEGKLTIYYEDGAIKIIPFYGG